MNLVRVLVRPQDRIDPLDAGIEQLCPQIGRGVDEEGLALVLDQNGAAPAPVAVVVRVRCPPLAKPILAARPRDTSGSAAAEDRHPHDGRSALANSLKKFAVVAASSSATPTPFSSATLAAVWAT